MEEMDLYFAKSYFTRNFKILQSHILQKNSKFYKVIFYKKIQKFTKSYLTIKNKKNKLCQKLKINYALNFGKKDSLLKTPVLGEYSVFKITKFYIKK